MRRILLERTNTALLDAGSRKKKRESKQNMKSVEKTATGLLGFDKPQDSFYNKEELFPAETVLSG